MQYVGSKNKKELDIPANSLVYCDPPYRGSLPGTMGGLTVELFGSGAGTKQGKGIRYS